MRYINTFMGRKVKEECLKQQKSTMLPILLHNMPSFANAYPCTPINTHQRLRYWPEKPALQHYLEISTTRTHGPLQHIASDPLSKRLKWNRAAWHVIVTTALCFQGSTLLACTDIVKTASSFFELRYYYLISLWERLCDLSVGVVISCDWWVVQG